MLFRSESILKNMTYDELMSFRYNKYFLEKGYIELYNNHLKAKRDEAEQLFDDLSTSMKINGTHRFDDYVMINVNLFSGYSIEELAEVFSRINQYNSSLTEQEALASRLFNITTFEIKDKVIEIRNSNRDFYSLIRGITYKQSSNYISIDRERRLSFSVLKWQDPPLIYASLNNVLISLGKNYSIILVPELNGTHRTIIRQEY